MEFANKYAASGGLRRGPGRGLPGPRARKSNSLFKLQAVTVKPLREEQLEGNVFRKEELIPDLVTHPSRVSNGVNTNNPSYSSQGESVKPLRVTIGSTPSEDSEITPSITCKEWMHTELVPMGKPPCQPLEIEQKYSDSDRDPLSFVTGLFCYLFVVGYNPMTQSPSDQLTRRLGLLAEKLSNLTHTDGFSQLIRRMLRFAYRQRDEVTRGDVDPERALAYLIGTVRSMEKGRA